MTLLIPGVGQTAPNVQPKYIVGSGPGITTITNANPNFVDMRKVVPQAGSGVVPGISVGGIIDKVGGFIDQNKDRFRQGKDIFQTFTGGCPQGYSRNALGQCVPSGVASPNIPGIPTGGSIPGSPGVQTPAERSLGGPGTMGELVAPTAVDVRQLRCPKFADGKKGILWMNALTGTVVCLPRGSNGRGYGLIRKNPKRARPIMSAADGKTIRKANRLQAKVKKLAGASGFTCRKK